MRTRQTVLANFENSPSSGVCGDRGWRRVAEREELLEQAGADRPPRERDSPHEAFAITLNSRYIQDTERQPVQLARCPPERRRMARPLVSYLSYIRNFTALRRWFCRA